MVKKVVAGALSLAILGLFLGLGTWQVQRLAWKQGVLADIEAQIVGAPQALPLGPDPDRDRYLPVMIEGTIMPGELHVLVSSRDYGAGFRIISPFETLSGQRVLVDRGFVLAARKNEARLGGDMRVEGNLHWPDERTGATPQDDPDGNWWYARDVEKMAAALGAEPVLIIARSDTGAGILPMPITTDAISNRHLEYALTWFSLAIVWVVMTVFAVWRIRRRNG